MSVGEEGAYVLSTFTLADPALLEQVGERLRASDPDVMLMDRRHFLAHTTELIRADLLLLTLAAAVIVTLCLLAFLGRLELALPIVAAELLE